MVRRGLGAVVFGAILIMIDGQSGADDRVAPSRYPERAPLGDGRRLPRPEGRRSRTARSRTRTRRPPGPGSRPRISITFRFLELDPAARGDPQAAHGALGLREVQPAAAGGRAVLLLVQHRLAEPERPVLDRRRSTARAGVLLDPNTLSADGTVALSGLAVSKDGRLLAYGIAAAGSDWNEWKVRDVATAQDAPDLIKWVKFSGAEWSPDGAGFLLRPVPRAPAGRRPQGGQLPPEGLSTTASGRPRPTIGWSGRTPNTRSGGPSPRSPTTAST